VQSNKTFAYRNEIRKEQQKLIKQIKTLTVEAKEKKIIKKNAKIAPQKVVHESNEERKEFRQ